eukprot:TRINITY_DN11612_c0_g1_i1.p1 TRINITY_DN11612_c0_g1~~TRINITY_DN11612_c0_g1_i1.p1  ORF type:complete len:116 (-),score=23.21 TRINITY_DN11612_c0_g1_i1:21-368(-)
MSTPTSMITAEEMCMWLMSDHTNTNTTLLNTTPINTLLQRQTPSTVCRIQGSHMRLVRTTRGVKRACLLYTSDAADDLLCVDLGGRRIIKKKKIKNHKNRICTKHIRCNLGIQTK